MYKNKNILILFFLLVFSAGIFLFVSGTDAQAQGLQYTLLEKIPGTDNVGSDLKGYLEAIYKVALIIIVLSAVLMLSIGGFMYLTSAGSTSAMGTAKGVIFDSLIGLVIALTAYLLLYVINPDLVNITLNGLSPTAVGPAVPPTGPPAACPSPPEPTVACCPQGIKCQACSSCSEVSGVTYKPCGLSKCFLNTTLLGKIKGITGVSGWRITESWPPTINRNTTNSCHENGTCADINNSGGPTDPTSIKKYYDAFTAAGLNVLYETKEDCAPYKAVGITNCGSYPSMTNGSSFHVW
ncbi:MAG: hypothetical protein WAW00_02095 [Candidatus Moraniibacteriota bacterium]